MFYTKPATLYLPLSIFPTMYKEIGFLSRFYDTVKTVAVRNLDDFIGGIRIFCDIKYENSSASSNYKILSIESDFTLKV